MLFTPQQILLIACIMTLGSVVQGAVGFASGMLGVPLLVLSGFSLPQAAIVNLVSTSVQNFTGAWRLWEHLDWRELVYPTVVRIFAIPLGTLTVSLVDQRLSASQSKQLIGTLLLVVVILMWGFRVQRRDHLNLFWQTLAYSSSGFLLGFASMGGAPMVLYVNSLTWGVHKSRAFLFFCSAVGQPLAAYFFWREFGSNFFPPALSTLIILPAVFAGLWIGLHWGGRLSQPLFRKLTLGLITLTALSAILSPFLVGQPVAVGSPNN